MCCIAVLTWVDTGTTGGLGPHLPPDLVAGGAEWAETDILPGLFLVLSIAGEAVGRCAVPSFWYGSVYEPVLYCANHWVNSRVSVSAGAE